MAHQKKQEKKHNPKEVRPKEKETNNEKEKHSTLSQPSHRESSIIVNCLTSVLFFSFLGFLTTASLVSVLYWVFIYTEYDSLIDATRSLTFTLSIPSFLLQLVSLPIDVQQLSYTVTLTNLPLVFIMIAILLFFISHLPVSQAQLLVGFNNNYPRQQQKNELPRWAQRFQAGHENAAEATPLFIGAVLAALHYQIAHLIVMKHCILWLVSRLAYHLCYALNLGMPRSICWFMGFMATLSLIGTCCIHATL
eukprot:gb/GECH01013813.1/.p1 GENE.gb/GECH01013813.1/~~gb/GECH01013813.1/.p1  ORF type:complete len:250 (+),score=39.11 gb/GECH01013813.1/:1-750(+)